MADIVVGITLPIVAEVESRIALSPAASVTDGDSIDRSGTNVTILAAVCNVIGGITVLIMANMIARIAGFATDAIDALGVSTARRCALAACATAMGHIGIRVAMPIVAEVVEGIAKLAAGPAQA